ncbi:MAG TPA: HEAT repeat domain-containing protein [Gemmatimonadota bacterium]|nr:HEAT repeat domain-containing protein [Gemmatimonadota bacterium]
MSNPQMAAAAATELVQELVRVFKVRRLYGPGHPQRMEIETVAARRLASLLAEETAVELEIHETSLHAGGEVVYEQSAGPESLANILFREGLRQLVFHDGLTAEELGGFLDEVWLASQQRADEEFDLVARLWEQRFVHIRYLFVEALSDEDWRPPAEERLSESDLKSLQVHLSEEDLSALDRPPTVLLADPTLYFLDDEDMAELQGGLDDEKGRALFVEVLTCVRELLMEPVVDDISPAVEMIEDIHAEYLRDQIYRRVIEIQEIFVPYLESKAATEVAREAFARMKESALSEATLTKLGKRLLAGELDEAEAGRFVRAFGAGRLRALLTGLSEIKRVCQHPALSEAFSELARSDEGALRGSLASDNPQEAVAAAFIVGLTGDSRHLEALGETLSSDDAEVRREALLTLKGFGGGRALEFVSRAVNDGDPSVRLYALRHLVSHRYAPALPRVVERIARQDAERSLTEQRLLYEAYGALGGEEVVGELVSRFRRRKGLFRKRDPEEAACVLIALGATGSLAARELVEEASADRHPLVARVAGQVLQSWGAVGAGA